MPAGFVYLSSAYALAGKFLKGFSGAAVDGMAGSLGRMDAYAVFFIACGAVGVPSLALFWWLARRPARSINPA